MGVFGIYLGRHAGCAKCGLDRALWAERNHRILGGMRSLAVFKKTDFLDVFGFGWGLASGLDRGRYASDDAKICFNRENGSIGATKRPATSKMGSGFCPVVF